MTRKRAWKIFKGFLISIASLIALVLVLVLAIVIKPSLLINDRTLKIAAPHLQSLAKRSGIDVSWDQLGIRVESRSLLKKRVEISAQGLCVDLDQGAWNGCLERLLIASVVDFSHFKLKFEELGPIELEGGNLGGDLSRPKAKAEAEKKVKTEEKGKNHPLPLWLESALQGSKFQPIRIDIPSIEIKSASSRLSGAFSASGAQALKTRLQAHARTSKGDSLRVDSRTNVDLARFSVDTKTEAWAALRTGRKHPGRGHAVVQLGTPNLFELDRIQLVLSAEAHRLIPEVRSAWVKDCRLDLARDASEVSPGSVNLNCPVDFAIPIPPKGFPRLKIPTRAGVKLVADLKTSSYPPSPGSRVRGNLGVLLSPVLTPLFEGQGSVHAAIDGVPDQFPERWRVDTDLGLFLKVPHFERWVAELRKGAWAIPAPLNVLKGSLEFGLKGKLDLEKGQVPLMLRTRLASQTENLDLDGNGTLHLNRLVSAFSRHEPAQSRQQAGLAKPSQPAPADESDPSSPEIKLDFELALSNVQLELPKLDLAVPPRLVPDQRVHRVNQKKELPKEEKPSSFDYDIRIKTPASNPVRILSNLAQAPIPISLDVDLKQSQPLGGTIHVGTFPLHLFRRDASVDHFDLTLQEPMANSPIDGAVKVSYADYAVTVRLISVLGKPIISMTSDPPLPEEQLVAVLLFGHPLNELDPSESSSVDRTRAAMTDGAMSLASLYVLASTPVESVDYDPRTHVVSAKVRLAEGTSLNVGTGSGQLQELGIRRKLSTHWTITAEFDNVGQTSSSGVTNTDASTASMFLEWNLRY